MYRKIIFFNLRNYSTASRPGVDKKFDFRREEILRLAFSKKSVFKPLGRLPNWHRKGELKSVRLSRINRYLNYQESRLIALRNAGELDRLTALWCFTLKNSKAYQLSLFNKVIPT